MVLRGRAFWGGSFVKEIDVVGFLVAIEGGLDGFEQGDDGLWRGGGGMGFMTGLADGIELIGGGVIEFGDGAVGPGDDEGIGMSDGAQADDLFVVDGGLEAAAGDDFAVEDLTAAEDPDLAADGKGVGGQAMEEDGEVMVMVQFAGIVAVDEGRSILVVDDQVQVAVIVQVAVGGAVGKGGMCEAPIDADVLETQIAQIAIHLVQQGGLGDAIEQLVDVLFFSAERHLLVHIIGEEVKEIEIRNIPVDAVADKDVIIAIVVGVEHKGPPGPVGSRDAGKISDLGELAVAVVELEAVLYELIIETGLEFAIEETDVVKGACCLQPVIVSGQHVGSEKIGIPVVIDIGHIDTHGRHTDMPHAVFQLVLKGPVALVDVEIVSFIRVVGDIDIGPAVAVDVGDHCAQPEADQRAMDAGFLRDFSEMTVVVAIKVVAAAFENWFDGPCRVDEVAPVGIIEGIHRNGAVLDHKAVEIAIAIIVKKGDLGSIGGDIETIFFCRLGECAIVVIDVQLVPAVAVTHVTGIANVDIEPAVVVDVDENRAGTPHAILLEPGFGGDVFELEISFIKIEFVGAHVGRKEDVREAVVIDVSDGYAAAVIEIPEKEAVVETLIDDFVIEVNSGILHQLKERPGCWRLVFAGETENTKEEGAGEEMGSKSEHIAKIAKITKAVR